MSIRHYKAMVMIRNSHKQDVVGMFLEMNDEIFKFRIFINFMKLKK